MASKPDNRPKKTWPKSHSRPANYRPKPAGQTHQIVKKEEDVAAVGVHYDDKMCVICCEEILIFAKGSCDHVVCYKCSSRMRVLCEENYCAVCRMNLDKVAFIENIVPFDQLDLKRMKVVSKHGIYCHNDHVKNVFDELLDNKCTICTDPANFSNFRELRRHMRQSHDRQYCDICIKNLKIFPKEFRVYTRTEIVAHRKTGDADDKSYKGHPQCNFCSERYFDSEDLHNHLRKSHFWCHFCEKDGKQFYYGDYDGLRGHFQADHILCEEGECEHEKYTSVFRTDIDYQAHRIARHSKRMGKMAAKQARQLNVDIDYGTRRSQAQRSYAGGRDVEQRNYSRSNRNNERKSPELKSDGPKKNPKIEDQNKLESSSNQKHEITQQLQHTAESKTSSQGSFQNEFPMLNEKSKVPGTLKSSSLGDLQDAVAAATVADVIKKKSSQQSAQKNDVSSKKGASANPWSNQSLKVNINSEDAFPRLENGKPINPALNSLSVLSYENVAGVRKKETKNVSSQKHRINGHHEAAQRGINKIEYPSSWPKNKPPLGVTKVDVQAGSFLSDRAEKAPPGITKKKTTSTNQQAPPGIQSKFVNGKSVEKIDKKTMPPGITQQIIKSAEPQVVENQKSMQERNLQLVESIRNLLSFEDFNKFKDLSGSFRRSEITGFQYYNCISDLLGADLDLVFVELVDLLPDKMKQEELLKVYNFRFDSKEISKPQGGVEDEQKKHQMQPHKPMNSVNNDYSKIRFDQVQGPTTKTDSKPKVGKWNDKEVTLCTICGVSLSKKEAKTHMDIHVISDFPELPVSARPAKIQPWKKQRVPTRSAWGGPK